MAATLIYGYATGPDPRHTGAPGDDPKACASSGCHVGTAVNGGGGSVAVTFASGQSYVPGQQQTFNVKVTDSKAKIYGFQMTARLASDPANGEAGNFTAGAGTGQIVICDDGSFKGANGCSARASVQFVEHGSPNTSGSWTVTWTPPTSNVGNVMIYVAGNAANADGNDTGDHIYTANYTLTPAVAGTKPTTSQDGIVSASAFNPKAGVASGTWLEIFGSNISTTTRGWGGADFSGSNAPTNLDGVQVTINGKSAYVDYVSPGQVNVQVPDDSATGPVQLIVKNAAGQSDPVTVQKLAIAPALLAPGAFNVGGKQYVVATFATSPSTYVGKAGLISGLTFKPAQAGDLITIYGIGFGPVDTNTPAGQVAPASSRLLTKPNFLFGETAGDLSCTGCYYGLAPGAVGLYQFNVKVPAAGSGDVALKVVDVGGVSTNQTLFITLQ